MTAMNITNHHGAPLAIGGVTIQPGRTAAVAHWDRVKSSKPIQTWVQLGVISVDGDTPKPQDPAVVRDESVQPSTKPIEDMTKAELVEYGQLKGVVFDPSASKAEIFDKIVDAEAS